MLVVEILIVAFFMSVMILGGFVFAIGIAQVFFGRFRDKVEEARETAERAAADGF